MFIFKSLSFLIYLPEFFLHRLKQLLVANSHQILEKQKFVIVENKISYILDGLIFEVVFVDLLSKTVEIFAKQLMGLLS